MTLEDARRCGELVGLEGGSKYDCQFTEKLSLREAWEEGFEEGNTLALKRLQEGEK